MTAATSKGACRGHQGIDKDATAAQAAKASKRSATPAPGGGAGMVWANEETKVYHCQGDRYYGTTKKGAYMSAADAKAKGLHAAKNSKNCAS